MINSVMLGCLWSLLSMYSWWSTLMKSYEAINNPMDSGLTNQVQPPNLIINNTNGSTNYRTWRKMTIAVIKKMAIVKIMYFRSFSCWRELWFRSFGVLSLFGSIQLHLRILHSAKMHEYSFWVFNMNCKDTIFCSKLLWKVSCCWSLGEHWFIYKSTFCLLMLRLGAGWSRTSECWHGLGKYINMSFWLWLYRGLIFQICMETG